MYFNFKIIFCVLKTALKATSTIDDEIENIDSWIDRKERELEFDESPVILSEEQFYEKYKKYCDIKQEIDHNEPRFKIFSILVMN